jgi:hypothetical protein
MLQLRPTRILKECRFRTVVGRLSMVASRRISPTPRPTTAVDKVVCLYTGKGDLERILTLRFFRAKDITHGTHAHVLNGAQ